VCLTLEDEALKREWQVRLWLCCVCRDEGGAAVALALNTRTRSARADTPAMWYGDLSHWPLGGGRLVPSPGGRGRR